MSLIKYNNQSLSSITQLPAGIATGKLKLISSQTASNSASISFTSGLNSTYKVYKFVFVNIHPRTDDRQFQFNLSTDGGANYNVTKTSTVFRAYHNENDASAVLTYDLWSHGLAQSTAVQRMTLGGGSGADESTSGTLMLFNPASTTYVKHFITVNNEYYSGDQSFNNYIAGYANTTSAVNAIQFTMASGNFDGTIYLYAIES